MILENMVRTVGRIVKNEPLYSGINAITYSLAASIVGLNIANQIDKIDFISLGLAGTAFTMATISLRDAHRKYKKIEELIESTDFDTVIQNKGNHRYARTYAQEHGLMEEYNLALARYYT